MQNVKWVGLTADRASSLNNIFTVVLHKMNCEIEGGYIMRLCILSASRSIATSIREFGACESDIARNISLAASVITNVLREDYLLDDAILTGSGELKGV